jgi:hypothetical protein
LNTVVERVARESETALQLPNHQLVVVAAFLVGAHSSIVDTEDIAVKANELAPGRFSWRKYKEQINIDTVRKRLWDATKPEKGGYLIGSEKSGWRLTKAGFDFAQSQTLAGPLVQIRRDRTSQTERTGQNREINRMMNEPAFHKVVERREIEITKAEAERFFRVDDYVTGTARTAKIERFRIIAANNKVLLKTIETLAALIKEK